MKNLKDSIRQISPWIRDAERLFLFLDYDGTLTRFRREPMDARPSERMTGAISKLAGSFKTQVTIVSGRDIASLLELFKGFDNSSLNWSGAHGMQMRFSGSGNVHSAPTLSCIALLRDEISLITSCHSCFILEDKGLAFALHYRKCSGKTLRLLKKVESIIASYQEKDPIEVMHMKKVIEVKPKGINKGNTIKTIISRYDSSGDFLTICIGDDVTDEYLFLANPRGINIKVGDPEGLETSARYYLKGIGDVYWFLKEIPYLRHKNLS